MSWFRRKPQVWETSDSRPFPEGVPLYELVKETSGLFGKIILTGNGTNLATAVVYDNPDDVSGRVVARAATKTCVVVEGPVACSLGISFKLTGTGANAVVLFR